MKETILFQMKSTVKAITLQPLGVPDLYLRSQECPPKSGSVPDGCHINFLNFDDTEECHTSNCVYFNRQIHWWTHHLLITFLEPGMSSSRFPQMLS